MIVPRLFSDSTQLLSLALGLSLLGDANAQLYTWIQNPGNGHWYAYTTSSYRSWNQAHDDAIAAYSHLVTIDSQAEEAWLTATFAATCYIGLRETAGTWGWVTGEPLTYTNWASNQPWPGYNVAHLNTLQIGGGNPPSVTWISLVSSNTNFASGAAIFESETDPLAYISYRLSCNGSTGLPRLVATPFRMGQNWTLTVSGLAPNRLGYLFFALRDDRFGINLLPLDLAFLGAPGCYVNVSPDPTDGTTTFFLPSDSNGRAQVQIVVPNTPVVLGHRFHNQYVSLDSPSSRPLTITMTNAGTGIIGR